MDFITTIEDVKYCRENCKLDIREVDGNIIGMYTTECVDPFEFNKNLCKAVGYIKTHHPGYRDVHISREWRGASSNAIVSFEEIPQREVILGESAQ
jgi:hypothetical protein